MATDTSKVKAKLAALTASFDDLEELLEPLFGQTLPETLVGLEPLQQAKLQTVLPYLVYDLIFIYLKTRGIDPKTHPVIPELDRIRQYFEKISNAENPPAKRMDIDKAAAGRFIKHAIAQSQWKKTAAEEMQDEDNAPTSGAPNIPVKVTQKMRERAGYEQAIKAEDAMENEEETLEVFENGDDDTKTAVDTGNLPTKGKGKETASTRNKRQRPAVDVFTGLPEDHTSLPIKKSKSSSPSPPTPVAPSTGTSNSKPSEKSKSSNKKTKKKSKQ